MTRSKIASRILAKTSPKTIKKVKDYANSLVNKKSFIINPSDKFYPKADEWMWNYCTYLGKFTDSSGKNWDLGIFLQGEFEDYKWSAACVYGNIPGNYISGGKMMYLDEKGDIRKDLKIKGFEHIKEMIRRAKILNLIK